MPKITYVEASGERYTVEVSAGYSVMEGAKLNNVPGIEADCGGACACATCHVYITPEWRTRVGPPGDNEQEMLDCATDLRDESRLSCQIKVTDELDGLVVDLPATQR